MGTRSSASAIQKYLSGVGEGVGSPLQLRKFGIFYISCLVERSVPVPMETYSTCDFRGGERFRSLTDFTWEGGGCSITCRGVVSVQYSYGKL